MAASCLFFEMWNHFLLSDLLTFEVCNLSRVLTNLVLMYLLVRLQRQFRRSRCHYRISKPLQLFFLFVKYHYSGNSFFGKTIYKLCFLHFFSVYRNECFGEIYEQMCCLDIFERTTSMIWRIVRICVIVERFLRKLFWFFQRIFLIFSWIRLGSRAL